MKIFKVRIKTGKIKNKEKAIPIYSEPLLFADK